MRRCRGRRVPCPESYLLGERAPTQDPVPGRSAVLCANRSPCRCHSPGGPGSYTNPAAIRVVGRSNIDTVATAASTIGRK
jgi:hypothetical protein